MVASVPRCSLPSTFAWFIEPIEIVFRYSRWLDNRAEGKRGEEVQGRVVVTLLVAVERGALTVDFMYIPSQDSVCTYLFVNIFYS